ncbi:MAG: M56 family metallopeptidase [Planctomycetota bacterium]
MIGLDSIASERLCLTLLHSLWQVALLALAAWGINRCLGRHRENASYVVHATALAVGLIAAPITHAFLSYGGSVTLPASAPFVAEAGAPADLASGVSQLPLESTTAAEAKPPSLPASPITLAAPVIGAVPGFAWQSIMPWLAGAYLFGVVLMLARLARSALLLERLRATAQPVVDGPVFNALANVCSQWSLKTAPVLAHAEHVVVPKVVGLLKPTILLPSSALTGLPINDLELILAHELAHVRRHDLWINLLQRLAESILFFNPAMWWLSRRVSTLREYCCDDRACAVIPEGAKPQLRYAEALLHAVELQHTGSSEQVAALAATGRSPSDLRRRVARLFGEPIGESIRLSRSGVAVLLAGAALLLVAPTAADSSGMDKPNSEANPDSIIGLGETQTESDASDLESAGRFRGRVTGPDGEPARGAKVYYAPVYGMHRVQMREVGPARATTDEQGLFEFEAVDTADDPLARRYGVIIATSDGLGRDWIITRGTDGTPLSYGSPRKGTPLNLQLSGPDVPLQGKLLGPDGQPLVGAQVKLTGLKLPWRLDLDSHLLNEEKKAYVWGGPRYAKVVYQPESLPGLDSVTTTDRDGRFVLRGIGRDRLADLLVSHPRVIDTHLRVMGREGKDFDATAVLPTKDDVEIIRVKTIYASSFTAQLRPRPVGESTGE